MANATQTIAGDIQLAGDLAGNNDAANPALTTVLDGTPGKIPGSYVLASITVDGKGRVTTVSEVTPPEVLAHVPVATTTSMGVVQIGDGLSVTNGLVSAGTVDATYTTKGVVQIDSDTMIVSSGVISIPVASTTKHGTIMVGDGLTVTNGVLSADALPPATSSTLGLVSVGSGLDVDVAGVLSADVATTGAPGIVQVGSGLAVSAGTISVAPANNASAGVVYSANTNNITITNGAVNTGTNVALLNTNNVYTKAQCVTPSALTYGANISVNAALSNIYTLTMTGNGTLTNPTNLVAGSYTFIIKQDAAGSRTLAYGTAYKFVGGTPALSTTSNATDVLRCVSDGTNVYCTLYKNFI